MNEDVFAELRKRDDGFDLGALKVMHMLHELESKPEDVSSTVRLGFKWAEIGEGQGLFLCVCSAQCLEPQDCGRLFFDKVVENQGLHDGFAAGREQIFELPLPDTEDGTQALVFSLWVCNNCELRGTGAVFDTWVGRFFDIPARLLQFEHEERSRSYLGLRKSMGKAYPDAFAENSYVTLLLYKRAS